MKCLLIPAAAVIGMMALLPVCARAQAPNPAASVFPLNEPETFRYTDAQGMGSITFVDIGPDAVTGFDVLRVILTRNGVSHPGAGMATPIPGAARPLTNLVSFTVVGPNGVANFYQGKMGLGVEYQGEGTYYAATNPTQTSSWGLLFVPGTPGPQPKTLSLSIDKGPGSSYPTGGHMVITYSASTNDLLTLRAQGNGSSQVLFANKRVKGGMTYTFSPMVASVPGPCTLILSDSGGVQTTCSFTAVKNP